MSTEAKQKLTLDSNKGGGKSGRSFLSGAQIMQTVGMLPILVLITIGFYIANDRFLSLQNLSIITQQASINVVLASGMTLVIIAGGIDLSVGSVLAACAMVSVGVTLIPGFEYFGLAAGLLAGVILGLTNGSLIAYVGLPAFIVTLGTLTAYRGIARLIGNERTLLNPDLSFAFIGNDGIFGISYLVIIAVGVVLLSWWILRFTVLGMRIYAIGGNQAAARLAPVTGQLTSRWAPRHDVVAAPARFYLSTSSK